MEAGAAAPHLCVREASVEQFQETSVSACRWDNGGLPCPPNTGAVGGPPASPGRWEGTRWPLCGARLRTHIVFSGPQSRHAPAPARSSSPFPPCSAWHLPSSHVPHGSGIHYLPCSLSLFLTRMCVSLGQTFFLSCPIGPLVCRIPAGTLL